MSSYHDPEDLTAQDCVFLTQESIDAQRDAALQAGKRATFLAIHNACRRGTRKVTARFGVPTRFQHHVAGELLTLLRERDFMADVVLGRAGNIEVDVSWYPQSAPIPAPFTDDQIMNEQEPTT